MALCDTMREKMERTVREAGRGAGTDPFTERIRQYIEKYRLIRAGDSVCAGLSGGADSVCLLMALVYLRDHGELPPAVSLSAVHVNHCLRGAESDKDQDFVRALCGERKIPLYMYSYPVREIAGNRGMGEEETGRLLRREAYAECIHKHGVSVIALAHHRNDCAETFLFHAARGSSLKGMAGIRPAAEFAGARMIRPLLCVRRDEIEDWLSARKIPWRTDRTNLEDDYTRNGIRHRVIPYLEEHVNTGAVDHMADLAGDLAEAEDYLAKETQKAEKKYVSRCGGTAFIRDELRQEPEILQKRVLYEAFCGFGGSEKNVGRTQILDLKRLMDRPAGKQLDLPYGVRALREYEGIRLLRGAGKDNPEKKTPDPVKNTDGKTPGTSLPCPGEMEYGGWRFTCVLHGQDELPRILERLNRESELARKKSGEDSRTQEPAETGGKKQKQYTKWLDYDKIKNDLSFRTRQPGDYLTISGDGGRKKLKKYLIDSKIPRMEREKLVLLASGSEVWWIVGYRISGSCRVTENTRRILEISAEEI
ncbi:tRNA lysidine(34) synthetase TilS [Lachnospiraceae bacterium Oil+RF-744-WCA-WT-13]|uniref:tRNA(Ile)-lysidine synthase n=2 Tax=Bilifractor porci TaxID=2606636 RepID=A0A7X2TMS2_9FIRM|nr:tRNA lysidine(34) synthetase TilS [Bilifractor porci]